MSSDGSVVLSLEASAVNFSDDAKTLVLGGERGGAPWLRDVATGAETRLSAAAAQISDLAVADRGSTLIAASTDGMAKQWDTATGELTRAFSCAAGTAVWSVAASESAPLIALGCMDGSVSLWNRTTGERVAQPMRAAGSGYAFTGVTFARDGQLLDSWLAQRSHRVGHRDFDCAPSHRAAACRCAVLSCREHREECAE